MRLLQIVLAAILLSAGRGDAQQPRTRVVLELFTSEGCSSCPPADELLRRLIREQPIPGVEVVALSEHVDYWNRLGWKDPFSSSRFTERQEEYAQHFDGNGMYTPQAVIDGRWQVVGNDWQAVRKALVAAADAPKATVDVQTRTTDGRVSVSVTVADAPRDPSGDVDLMLAIVENGLSVDVKHGENARRRLEHDAVVRKLERIGTLSRGAHSGTFTATVSVAPDWSAAKLQAVVFLQQRRGARIVGASAAGLGL